MTSRKRESTTAVRCWQALGTAVVVLAAFAVIGVGATLLAAAVGLR